MSMICQYAITGAIILLALLLVVVAVSMIRWMRLDSLYKQQRMLKDRSYVYSKEAERLYRAGADSVKAEHVRDSIVKPYDAESAIEAALFDVRRRPAQHACVPAEKRDSGA